MWAESSYAKMPPMTTGREMARTMFLNKSRERAKSGLRWGISLVVLLFLFDIAVSLWGNQPTFIEHSDNFYSAVLYSAQQWQILLLSALTGFGSGYFLARHLLSP